MLSYTIGIIANTICKILILAKKITHKVTFQGHNLFTLTNFTRNKVSNFVSKCVTEIIIIQIRVSKMEIIMFIENENVSEHYY